MRVLKILLLLSSTIVLLTACGDEDEGGGNNGFSYTGKTTPATISQDNSNIIATGAFQGGKRGSAVNILSMTQSEGNEQDGHSYTIVVSRVLEHAFRKVDVTDTHFINAAVETGSVSGDCGGIASYNIDINQSTGDFSGSMNFNGFCSDGVTISGNTSFSGKVNVNTGEPMHFSFHFDALSCSCDSDSVTLLGDIAFNFTSNPVTTTMNMLLKENNSGKVYKVENYNMSITEGSNYVDVVITGRYYDPDHGYVNISTPSPLRIYDTNNWPSQGNLVCTGDNGTKARLEALSNSQYKVECDTNGDGSYDYDSGPLNWSDV
jgi:hypothetical protein